MISILNNKKCKQETVLRIFYSFLKTLRFVSKIPKVFTITLFISNLTILV